MLQSISERHIQKRSPFKPIRQGSRSMPSSRQPDPIRPAAPARPTERAALTPRMSRLRGGAPASEGAAIVPFYPFAHLPLLRTESYGQRCLWRLNYPSRN
jgi:hypothetical protein